MLIKYINQIDSFEDFYKITSKLDNKEKGDLFEELTKYIFMYDPYYKTITKQIWLYNEIPNDVLVTLNIPSKDKGIDLVMLSKEDKYYSIQCKFRQNPNNKIKWSDLGTFVGMTFGIGNNFYKAFFVTNINDINKEISRQSDKIIPLYGEYFDGLDNSFFNELKIHLIKNIKIIKEIIQPRDYQMNVINKSVEHFKNNDRGYIILACGTGKTLTSYWIHKEMKSNFTIIAVPSLYLLSQFGNELIIQSDQENYSNEFIFVGSDADIDEGKYQNNRLILTTDPDVISESIKRLINKRIIIITTYQSSDKLLEGIVKSETNSAILLIADESHKLVGDINKQFSLLLHDDKVTINKRLFMTATAKIYSGKNEDIISMDDEKYYGSLIYEYNFGNAIKDKWLVDYQIITLMSDNEEINKLIKNNNYVINFENKIEIDEAHYIASAIMILNAIKNDESNHLVTYHNYINRSKNFCGILNKLKIYYNDEIKIYHINGTMSMSNRTKIIKDFKKSKISILCSAKVLNEGINISEIDSVMFVDNRSSTIDIIQCIGRGMRLYKGKNMCKIYLPVLLEDKYEENFMYKNVINITKALDSVDESVKENFIDQRKNSKRKNKFRIFRIQCEEIISKKINMDEWIHNIGYCVWSKDFNWLKNYNLLVEHINDNNRLPSKHADNFNVKSLGKWCCLQRCNKKKGVLNSSNEQMLNKLNIWYWTSTSPKTFEIGYNDLQKFVMNNNRLPLRESKDIEEKSVANWCYAQRKNKIKGKLKLDQEVKLNTISCWTWNVSEKKFMTNYYKLESFINNNNKLPTSRSPNQEEKNLGAWCVTQRRKKREGTLLKNQEELLQNLKLWHWGKNMKKTFDESYIELIEFINNNNRLPSPSESNLYEHRLYAWCSTQRGKKKNNKLKIDQEKKLQKVKFWWWHKPGTNKKTFDENYNDLTKFINNNNKLPFKSSENKIENNLYIWCSNQRAKKCKGKLNLNQVKQLESLPNWYWSEITKISFNERYGELVKFIDSNKRLPLKKSEKIEESKLSGWCTKQRQKMKNGKLTKEHEELLNKLGNAWFWSKYTHSNLNEPDYK